MAANQGFTPFGPLNEVDSYQNITPYGPVNETQTTLVQYLPTVDTYVGSFTSSLGGPLYQAVNDASPDTTGTTYIQSAVSPAADSYCEGRYGNAQPPASLENFTWSYIITATGTCPIRMELRYGTSTLIKSFGHTILDGLWHQYDQPISAAELTAAGITDWSQVRWRFIANAT